MTRRAHLSDSALVSVAFGFSGSKVKKAAQAAAAAATVAEEASSVGANGDGDDDAEFNWRTSEGAGPDGVGLDGRRGCSS